MNRHFIVDLALEVYKRPYGPKFPVVCMDESPKQMIDEMNFQVEHENILLVGFKNEKLRNLIGKTLAEIASERNISPNEAIVNLIYEDSSRVEAVYFSMSEDNIKKKLLLPYMSICSDAGPYSTEGVFLAQNTHPGAYGSFARLLGKYVREEKIITLEEAIYKLTLLPATNFKIKKRGALPGRFVRGPGWSNNNNKHH